MSRSFNGLVLAILVVTATATGCSRETPRGEGALANELKVTPAARPVAKGGIPDDSIKPAPVARSGVPDDSVKPAPVARGGIPDDSIKPRPPGPLPTPAPR